MIDRTQLFSELAARQPAIVTANGAVPDGTISVGALVTGWLARGPQQFDGDDRAQLDALCRQIDVRKRVSTAYGPGWKRIEPEANVSDIVLSGLVAVLLANAAGVGGPGEEGARNDGWGLKCTNSALKALDLAPAAPHAPELRAWAMERLDAMREPATP